MQVITSTNEQQTPLQQYLHSISWHTNQFTNARLEIMLEASCLRFLQGLTDINFVLDLAEAIQKKQDNEMSLPLRYSTAILHDLAEELHNKTLSDTETITHNISNAQEILAKKK
jgi:hypothetical protein